MFNLITIKDLVTEYGDMPLNEDVIRLFGIVEPKSIDCMLTIKDVEKILKKKTGSTIIKKLKYKNNLYYDEAVIPASILAKTYGFETKDIINYIKEKDTVAAVSDE